MVELQEWLVSQGRPKDDVQMLRIDELAELGCCCFCSILYIGNDTFLKQNPEKVKAFMRAVKKATDYVLASPEQAYADYVDMKPLMGSSLNRKIFERSFAYFSKDLQNVQRDWVGSFFFLFQTSKYCILIVSFNIYIDQGYQLRKETRCSSSGLYPQLYQ